MRLRPAGDAGSVPGVRHPCDRLRAGARRACEGDDMKRRLFTILASLSLILFLATVVLWVRSYRRYDAWTRYSRDASARGYQTLDSWVRRSQRGATMLMFATSAGKLCVTWGSVW